MAGLADKSARGDPPPPNSCAKCVMACHLSLLLILMKPGLIQGLNLKLKDHK